MNLPALSADIVHRVLNSKGDSAHNLVTVVQNLIQEAMDKKPEPEAKPPFIPKPSSPEVQEMWDKINEATARIVRENNLRIDQLTEAQCTEAIIQAFQCGDFKRLVRVEDRAQQVVYIPFSEAKELESYLERIQDALDGYWRTHPSTLAAVEAAVADANKFRIHLSNAITILRDVVEHGPCSDPDCCDIAMKCEAARQAAKKFIETNS